ncbi:hypothetical protein DNI29_13365 [Hymenobacter sediminis]|uniref:hypothetical protein n=1 Tax=Hymenobacter sediminis TaxID=2218621 RepID=UPI000F4FE5EF|nr:hypothetical protein [Hymenobacter sediminis]RPD47131.1 hypothetical protein DNI29_13365 [Hymenobacter sediminis]
MRKYMAGALLFLGVSASASAQQVPAFPLDTVQAMQRMFHKHRTGGWIWTAVGSVFAVRIASVAAGSSATDGFASTAGGTVVGVGLFGGVPAGIGIGKLTRFSKAKEQQTIELYQKSGILPPYVRKRLKPKYFSQ